MINRIGIIGVGGVGGYFGGKLCQLQNAVPGLKVAFVARGEHLRMIQDSGLQLSTELEGEFVCRPWIATDNPEELPALDLCLICVKEFDLQGVLNRIKSCIGDHTIMIPLLNGVDVYSRVRNVIKDGTVLPACVYVGTHIEHPGRVSQRGGACKILFGPDPNRPAFVPDEVINLFRKANIKSEWTQNVQAEIWTKFIFICAYGLVSAAYDKSIGQILEDDLLRNHARAVMEEAVLVAAQSGIGLAENIVEVSLQKARAFPYETKTSFQRDFERKDKQDERDLFAGSLIRIAAELGASVPKTQNLLCMLQDRKASAASRHQL